MSIIRSSFLLCPVNHTVILWGGDYLSQRQFSLTIGEGSWYEQVVYFVWWKESNVAKNFEAEIRLLWNCPSFMDVRYLVMKGGRRNATGLKINVAECWTSVQVFLTHNSLFLTDRKQDNKTWHKESKRKERREKKEKSTKWKMKWEKLIGLLWDLRSP